jgi:hypothetical protein
MSLVKELASKADLAATEARIKVYFVITIAIILLTNSKAMDVIGKLLGLIK